MPDVPVKHYPEPVLRQFVSDYLQTLGCDETEAAITADGIIDGALRWYPAQGQGLEKFFGYTVQLRNGGVRPRAEMTFVMDAPAVAHLDAGKGLGFVAAARGMDKAVEKAQQMGIGCVLVRHSNHYGTSGHHAARHGLIGIAFTTAGPEMAPWGTKTAVLGTNPWGIAIPRQDDFILILDMALTMSGQGMIRWAHGEGREIPITWALTKDGRRTTDPAEVLDGTQLPIGDFKGAGLSFMTDVIAGVLSGAKFGLDSYNDITNHDVGHCLIALDPLAFMTRDLFEERLINDFLPGRGERMRHLNRANTSLVAP